LISNAGEKLIVPYSDMMEQYLAIREELLNRGITPGLMKESAPLTVTVFDYGNLEQFAEPILFRRNLHSEGIRSGYWLLRPQYENCYTDHSGLRLPDSGTAKGSFDFCY